MAARKSLTAPVDDTQVMSVSQFDHIIQESLEAMFYEGVWIEGEIEGLRAVNKHAYFTLIENTPNGDKAVLNITIWARDLANVAAKLRNHGLELKNGLKVRFFGKPQFYAPQGKLSLHVKDVDTQFSVGDIAKKREELLRRLHDTGMTQRNKRCVVPAVPLRLGVVSSAQAAGWADARKHLVESGYGFSVLFCDVLVQGDTAPPMIAAAIRTLGKRDDVDVILVMRGGGSKSDLAAFDEEIVAMAIVQCPKPVFVGVGHEIDSSIADAVAHTTCKTPTACADEIISYVQGFVDNIDSVARHVRSLTQSALERARNRISVNIERLRTRPAKALTSRRNHLEIQDAKVKLLDPKSTMARGWSITRTASGKVVRSVGDVHVGETLVTAVADGEITSSVEGVSS
jgi:exodeoxyribonuclease VII large subunit